MYHVTIVDDDCFDDPIGVVERSRFYVSSTTDFAIDWTFPTSYDLVGVVSAIYVNESLPMFSPPTFVNHSDFDVYVSKDIR